VKSQYRTFLRTLHWIPDETWQQSLTTQVQTQFRQCQLETDPIVIQMALQDGQRQLQQLQSMVRPTNRKKMEEEEDTTEEEEDHSSKGGRDPSATDPDSWMNIKDTEDPRGRVGTQWPWQK